MGRVFYFCPTSRKPAGGMRIIYKHVEMLNKAGITAYVLHPRKNYRYSVFSTDAPTYQGNTFCTDDFFIIPEVSVGEICPKLAEKGLRYGIFVQNPYILKSIPRFCDDRHIRAAFQRSSFVLSISDDATNILQLMFPDIEERILPIRWAIDNQGFRDDGVKENLITFMPRKNGDHVILVLDCLRRQLPSHWRWQAISGVTESELRELLAKSSIFLSFGSFEGMPAPPAEAAISRNYVIGYHGNGGKEYWHKPNFETVDVCDISGFTKKIVNRVQQIDTGECDFRELDPGITKVKELLSSEHEYMQLMAMSERIKSLSSGSVALTVRVHLQAGPVLYYGNWLYTLAYKYGLHYQS